MYACGIATSIDRPPRQPLTAGQSLRNPAELVDECESLQKIRLQEKFLKAKDTIYSSHYI